MLIAILLVLHFCCAAVLTFGINWLALIPWRKAREAHWTGRARLLWPARRASGIMMISIPGALASAQLLLFPEIPSVYALAALAGFVGATLGAWPMAQAAFPERPFARWLRDLAAVFIIRFLLSSVTVGALIYMPWKFETATIVITLIVIAFTLWLIYGGMLWLLRFTGLLVRPSERLNRIVQELAASMALPSPKVWELRGFGANAFASPAVNAMIVTEGALAALPNEELSALCAHEFGHLGEPKRVLFLRILSSFVLLPGIFFKPAIAAWGLAGYLLVLVAIVLLSRSMNAFRRRMEKQADSVAAAHEGPSAGTYARALERLYEINRAPAVMSGVLTHPHLYDRLLAAGVTPAYPRPAPPERFPWPMIVAVLLLMGSAGVIALHLQEDQKVRAAMHMPAKHPK